MEHSHITTNEDISQKVTECFQSDLSKQAHKQRAKKLKIRKPETWKKQRLKLERHSAKELPSLPDCGHYDKGMYCHQLSAEDVHSFQNRFYKDAHKVKQDIFILRHCSVSAPKRCRSKDGIQRKSMVVHYNATTKAGSLVQVCRKTFTQLLGVKYGRVQGVVQRYIQSKRIPTENRGGDRHSKKFQKKQQSVCSFLSSLQGSPSSCSRCGDTRTIVSAEYDIRKLWHYYNRNAPHDLRVVESYFRNIFTKNFNITFGVPKENDKERDHCNRCYPKKKTALPPIKNESDAISSNEDLDLKILEMSYPPGEHFLFAPLPSSREPLGSQKEWRSGDKLEYENILNSTKIIYNCRDETKYNENILPALHSNQDRLQENTYQHTRQTNIHIPVDPNILNHIDYQSINEHQSHQILSPLNSQIQQLSIPHNDNLLQEQNNSDQQTFQSINMISDNSYVVNSNEQLPLNGNISVEQQNGNMFGVVLNDNNAVLNIPNVNHQVDRILNSNGILNINTAICNDDQCNVIHLGSHYENLNDLGNMTEHEINGHSNLSHTQSNTSEQHYAILSFSTQHSSNESQYSSNVGDSKINEPEKLPENKYKNYRCLPCRLTFTSQSTYYIHKKRHSERKTFQCDHCERNFRRRDAFKQHIRTHSNTKPFRCPECELSFAHRINLDIHMARHKQNSLGNNVNDNKCTICLKIFSSKDQLLKHNDWHNTSLIKPEKNKRKSFGCELCKKSFSSIQSLRVHKKCHLDEKGVNCKVCDHQATSLAKLSEHMLVHSLQKPYKCDICGLRHDSAHQRNVHLRTHEADKRNQYQCKICGKTYRSPVYLKRHTLTHSGERPFGCKVCFREYTTRYCLNRHMLHHSSEAPLQCGTCRKHFEDLHTLTGHLNIHHGDKPYTCDLCSDTFLVYSNLYAHKKKIHFDNSIKNSDKITYVDIDKSKGTDQCNNK